jgi:hypothetical protein
LPVCGSIVEVRNHVESLAGAVLELGEDRFELVLLTDQIVVS